MNISTASYLSEKLDRILHFPRITARKIKRRWLIMNAKKYLIVDSDYTGEKIRAIKGNTVETMNLLRVHNFINKGSVTFNSQQIDLVKYKNATVYPESDFIVVGNKAIWLKFFRPQFTKIRPKDKDILIRKDSYLFIRSEKKKIEVKTAFSLCGVHSATWSHWLVQYLPKTAYIEEIRNGLDHNLTILIPNYVDDQVKEIVYKIISAIKGTDILVLNKGEVANCETLYHIDNISYLSDHTSYISPADMVIPDMVGSFLKNILVTNKSIFNQNNKPLAEEEKVKLYITRTGQRNILNGKEVEQYFSTKGYVFVAPHLLSLQEKYDLFNRATVITGPYSSGFSNVIFCRPGTKVLVFKNFQRIMEPFMPFFAKHFNLDVTAITGTDLQSENCHSSYTIPLDKIAYACNDLGI